MMQSKYPKTIETSLKEALIFCQKNDFSQAKELYQKLMQLIPNDTQVLTNLGTIEIQLGNIKEGIKLIKDSIKILPNQSHALSNLANALLEIGQPKDALNFYKKAITINSKQDFLYYNQGRAYSALKLYKEAIESYSAAINLNDHSSLAFNNRGILFHQLKNFDRAMEDFNTVINLQPHFAEGFYNRGRLKNDLSHIENAIDDYTHAIKLKSDYAEAFNNRGILFHQLKNFDRAMEDFNTVINLQPHFAEGFYNRGRLKNDLSHIENAIDDYTHAIKLKSDYAEAFNNRGMLFHQLKNFDRAMEDYNLAIQHKSIYFDPHTNKATLYKHLGLFQESIQEYHIALNLDKNHIDANYNLGLAYLANQEFSKGWPYYEKRLLTKQYDFNYLNFDDKKYLKNLDIVNKKILVLPEQGIGDVIFFARMLKGLEKNGNQIICLVDKRLKDLFNRSLPSIMFLNKEDGIDNIDYDYFIPMASLGFILNYSYKKEIPYLLSDKTKIHEIKADLQGKEFKYLCGISWKSANLEIGADKSMRLIDFLPIFKSLTNVRFINLQYGKTKEEINLIKKEHSVDIKSVKEIDNFNDIDGLASLIDMCDFVITTSNVTAHISGALGKITHLILPYASGKIWYWHEGKGKSLWYPSIEMYAQTDFNNWESPIFKITEKLKNRY